tara:strand:- start:61 stop:312 length:252 start_codon:yes stop_codon:yes gene_type:complete
MLTHATTTSMANKTIIIVVVIVVVVIHVVHITSVTRALLHRCFASARVARAIATSGCRWHCNAAVQPSTTRTPREVRGDRACC